MAASTKKMSSRNTTTMPINTRTTMITKTMITIRKNLKELGFDV